MVSRRCILGAMFVMFMFVLGVQMGLHMQMHLAPLSDLLNVSSLDEKEGKSSEEGTPSDQESAKIDVFGLMLSKEQGVPDKLIEEANVRHNFDIQKRPKETRVESQASIIKATTLLDMFPDADGTEVDGPSKLLATFKRLLLSVFLMVWC